MRLWVVENLPDRTAMGFVFFFFIFVLDSPLVLEGVGAVNEREPHGPG